MTPHDDCPLGKDGFTDIVRELATISATLKNMEHSAAEAESRQNKMLEKLEASHGKRLDHLEAVEGKHAFVAAVISAVIAGFALFGKYIFGGKA